MTKEGLDFSHYQGALTRKQVNQIWDMGIRFAWHKLSQGTNFKDKHAENNIKLLQERGIAVGPYHFVTNDNGIDQFNWFVKCTGNFLFDLPPAMDCEAFNIVNGNLYSERDLMFVEEAKRNFIADSIVENKFRAIPALEKNAFVVGAPYMLSYPNKDIIDVIGRRLKTWMSNFPKLQIFPQPAIYTNAGSGNKIFDMSAIAWSKYLLWVASWGVSSPIIPNIWKGKTYLAWQNYVGSGEPYGIFGDVDHDVWGNYMKFPFTKSTPSASASPSRSPSASVSASPSNIIGEQIKITLEYQDGTSWHGTVMEV